MKIKTQSINSRPNGKPKTKVNKRRLFFVFFSAFAVFFFFCSFIASMVSPKIDAPALNEEENLSNVTSDDFKGKLDPRLRAIEMQEQTGPVVTSSPASNEQLATQQVDQNVSAKTEDKLKTQEHGYDELPYDSRNSDLLGPDENESQPEPSYTAPKYAPPKQERPVQQYTPPPQPQQNEDTQEDDSLILRDKVKVQNDQPVNMVKVMVGNYSSPAEARQASQQLSGSGLNVMPFIKERNGTYTVQVGSFASSQKAQRLAAELRKKNIASTIIQE